MAGSFQKIHKPTRARALDTSGNNHHGQIYSGRALEFDGVTDYLHSPVLNLGSLSHFTMSCWIMFPNTFTTDAITNFYVGDDTYGHSRAYAQFGNYTTDNTLMFSINKISGGNRGVIKVETAVETNTWYRAVGVYDGSNDKIEFYLNGVSIGTDTPSDESAWSAGDAVEFGSHEAWLGWVSGGAYAEQNMCDAQFWDAVWTQADITYDYLNPEQLALNRGGTSLTESNLKLWYPMQDGHRGQQSFILDGANTGLDTSNITTPNLSDNEDYDGNDDSNWILDTSAEWTVVTNTSTSFGATTDSDISGATTALFYISSNNSEISANLPIGNYKITGTLSTTGTLPNTEVRLRWYNTGSAYTDSDISAGDFVIYANTTVVSGNTHFRFTTSTEGHNFTLSNVKVTPVNAKNHATTVFLGDEEAVNGDMETFPTLHATNNDTFTDESVDGSQNVTMTTDSTTPYADSKSSKLTMNDSSGYVTYNKTDYVVGRTYLAEVYMRAGTGQTISAFQMFADDSIRGEDGTDGANITPSTSYARAYVQFVATATTMMINCKVTGTNTHYAFMDNFSIKEVGTATGWTDADQQLDIPQTALQSYNQLAWFDGNNDSVLTGYSLASLTAFSISTWFSFGSFGSDMSIFGDNNSTNYGIEFETGNTFDVLLGDTVNGTTAFRDVSYTVTTKKLHHLVLTRSGTAVKVYINGEVVKSGTISSVDLSSWDNFQIGAKASVEYFNGFINETSIWSDELTLAEVQELYNDGTALDALTHSGVANLTGYWRNNGLATWEDLSTNSNNGTIYNTTETLLITAGVDGSRDNQGFLMNRQRTTNSLNLPYGTTYTETVDSDTLDMGTDDFSIGFWIKLNSSVDNQCVVEKCNGSFGKGYAIFLQETSGQFKIAGHIDTSSAQVQDPSDTLRDYNTWYYYVATFDRNGSITHYVNGAADGTVSIAATSASISNSNSLLIGKSTAGLYIDGNIDDLTIYTDKLLSLPEITRNYNAGKRSHR